MEFNQLVASKIRNVRKETGLSAEYVATELGITKGAYSNLENGKVEITLTRLESLSKILDKPLTVFLPNAASVMQISNGPGNNINCNSNTNNFVDPGLVEVMQTAINSMQQAISIIATQN